MKEESKKKNTKLIGKHSLVYDSIFKGRKDKKDKEEDDNWRDKDYKLDQASAYYHESAEPEEYHRSRDLENKVYEIILEKTNININSNRRKPSKADFNRYLRILLDELRDDGFTVTSVFVTLAFYFSENLYNMFKLVDERVGEQIMMELQEYKDMSSLDDIEFI